MAPRRAVVDHAARVLFCVERRKAMQADWIDRDDADTNRAIKRAMGVIAAVAVAAAAGLATIDQAEVRLDPGAPAPGAEVQGSGAATGAAPAGTLDPALMKIDHHGESHG
jgi:hypothetical protein